MTSKEIWSINASIWQGCRAVLLYRVEMFYSLGDIPSILLSEGCSLSKYFSEFVQLLS